MRAALAQPPRSRTRCSHTLLFRYTCAAECLTASGLAHICIHSITPHPLQHTRHTRLYPLPGMLAAAAFPAGRAIQSPERTRARAPVSAEASCAAGAPPGDGAARLMHSGTGRQPAHSREVRTLGSGMGRQNLHSREEQTLGNGMGRQDLRSGGMRILESGRAVKLAQQGGEDLV